MKSVTFLLSFLLVGLFATANPFICSTADCGGGTTLLSSAPTDGTTFYIVWFVSSPSAPLSATATPLPSATSGTANMGATTITNTSGTNYTIAIAGSIDANQNKPTISNVDFTLAYFTAASFPGAAVTQPFSVSTGTPLPVEFVNVDATVTDREVVISWSTAMELNNEIFVVESSLDGEEWNEIGTVKGAGNSDQILEYTYVDAKPTTTSKILYRVKQIDFDGKYDYSKVVMARINNTATRTVISPNPATSDIVTLTSDVEIETVEVVSLAGKRMDVVYNESTQQLNIATLKNGVYYVSVNGTAVKLVK